VGDGGEENDVADEKAAKDEGRNSVAERDRAAQRVTRWNLVLDDNLVDGSLGDNGRSGTLEARFEDQVKGVLELRIGFQIGNKRQRALRNG
jgi:hypothetical protein